MSTYYIAGYPVSDELYHHGIKGQKWGIRRYQNEDGTLTQAGKIRYSINGNDKVEDHIGYRMDSYAKKLDSIGKTMDKRGHSDYLEERSKQYAEKLMNSKVMLESYRSFDVRLKNKFNHDIQVYDADDVYRKIRDITINNMKKTDAYRAAQKELKKQMERTMAKALNDYV